MFLFIGEACDCFKCWYQIQIHLMFLFIYDAWGKWANFHEFKYISCSYLSSAQSAKLTPVSIFKYISCSYLSVGEDKFLCLNKFKYISCSYLSFQAVY